MDNIMKSRTSLFHKLFPKVLLLNMYCHDDNNTRERAGTWPGDINIFQRTEVELFLHGKKADADCK